MAVTRNGLPRRKPACSPCRDEYCHSVVFLRGSAFWRVCRVGQPSAFPTRRVPRPKRSFGVERGHLALTSRAYQQTGWLAGPAQVDAREIASELTLAGNS